MDKVKILAGRKAIDDYRAAHAQLHSSEGTPEDHTPLGNTMLSKLRELGFDSIEGFMKANKQAVREDIKRCVKLEGECDLCVGREKERPQLCYTRRLAQIPIDVVNMCLARNLRQGYVDALPPPGERKGTVIPMMPNCSITTHIVENAAFDWYWER